MLAIAHPDMTSPRLVDVPRLDAETQAIHDFEIEHGRADVSACMETGFLCAMHSHTAASFVGSSSQQDAAQSEGSTDP